MLMSMEKHSRNIEIHVIYNELINSFKKIIFRFHLLRGSQY